MPGTKKLRLKKKGMDVGLKQRDELLDFCTVQKWQKQASMSVLHLDLTMTQSEDACAKHKMRKDFDLLRGKTSFDDWELACILHMFYKLTVKGPLTRAVFREMMHNVFGMSRIDMVDRIYAVLDEPGRDVVGMKAQNFVKLMSVYCRGTLDEKIDFVFHVYDSLYLGYIGRETMVKLLVPTLLGGQKHENVETAIDMADLLMRKFDQDRDGRLTYEEFGNEIRKFPEQLELCGQVFPDRMKIYAFMATFTRNVTINPHDYLKRGLNVSAIPRLSMM
ncbi:hypothetical protein GE061_015129 [Apolygus lucorum]|uniref:Uncharacterized protein n=1 Tax=Apolygus lucorum TaxID=248454 RepID=A0A6A4JIJ2_APOLU|nr:hypothetical protein GE061_015129 [Apolygus lucorum]